MPLRLHPGCPQVSRHRFACGKFNSGQTLFRIAREENSVAGGNGKFDERRFHVSDVSAQQEQCRARSTKKITASSDEAVAGDALFVAQRAQALHAAGGEIVDQARIAGGRAAKMIADAVPQRGQIVFAHAEFVENFRRLGARAAPRAGRV